jgi:hypothetical protein
MPKIALNDHIGMLLLAWLPSTVIVFGLFVLIKREDCYMAIGYDALLTVAIWAINLLFITRDK